MHTNRIGVQIITRDRIEYLASLLISLRNQTIKNWDLIIIDNSDVPIVNHHLIQAIFSRLEFEGHRIKYIQASVRDIGALRNIALDNDDNEFGCRIDDDGILEPDYLELLLSVFQKEENAGCVGGIVPYLFYEKLYKPLPKDFNIISEFFDTKDDSVWFYNVPRETYVKADHIRSTMMYRNEVAKGIRHPEGFGMTGFREETVFSYAFIKNRKLQNYYVPNAVCWHVVAPKGGGREGQDMEQIKWENDLKMKEIFKSWQNQDLKIQ